MVIVGDANPNSDFAVGFLEGIFIMTKLNKTQIDGLNSLTSFETATDRHERSQAEIFRTDAAKHRKTVQFIVDTIGDAKGKKRDEILSMILCLTWLVNHPKKRDILSAWAFFAGEAGADIVAKAKAGKLGKCCTIRGAVTTYQNDAKPKGKRQGKSGQGKKTVSFKAEKSGKAKAKAPTTIAAKLELIEAFCEEQGFSFTEFVADWTSETESDSGKIAANG